jgi:RHS repeat-associated protein
MVMVCPNETSCPATWQSGRTQYVYDGDGRRVRQRDAGGGETVYAYDAAGQLAADYATSPPPAEAGTRYLTTDHLGSTRVVTDGTGTVKARYDYQPFGVEILVSSGSPRYGIAGYGPSAGSEGGLRHKFTGKERDQDTGLDYFGARYMSAAQGRFTSADPLLNSGRPPLPQSWNRYSYTLNNPLKYIDPEGLFEWEVQCAKGDKKCQEWRSQFLAALKTLKDALLSKSLTPGQRAKIQSVLSFYGDENKKNGVAVGFGYMQGDNGHEWKEGGIVHVKLDMDSINSDAASWANADKRVKPEIEVAAIVAHEGVHGADAWLYGNDYAFLIGRTTAESKGFDVQSLVNKGFNTLSMYGLWNPSWAKVDEVRQERLRQRAVERNAQEAGKRSGTVRP